MGHASGVTTEGSGTEAPKGVALALLIAMAGGAVGALADLGSSTQALALAGYAIFLLGIFAAGAWIVVGARRSGMSLRSCAWTGIKTTGSLLWHLLP
jgi:uncharacterized membrane protein (GlpM family)